MKRLFALLPAALAAPALAHPGNHEGMNLSELASHLFETDHIVFALLAAGIGVLAYRAGRRAEARAAKARRERRDDPR